MNAMLKLAVITLLGTAISIAVLSRIPAVWNVVKKAGA